MKWLIFVYYLVIALYLGQLYQKKIEAKFPLYFQMLRLAKWSRKLRKEIEQSRKNCLKETRKFGGQRSAWHTEKEKSYQKIKTLREEKRLPRPEDGPPVVFSPEVLERLHKKLREHDIFKAKSMERGGHKVIR